MDPTVLRDRIISKAREFGADDAGVCVVLDLLSGPTHNKFPFPDNIKGHDSILVFCVSHPPDQPELDYFVKRDGARYGNSSGNRRLMDISEKMGSWLAGEEISSRDLHYYVERGGIFLKGAAVLAGLGTIGVNNLFIHPGYGPRIRLRAHLINTRLTPSPILDFDPCKGCPQPCLDSCLDGALDQTGYRTEKCQVRLDRDFEEGIILPADEERPAAREAHCCRLCELACSYTGTSEIKAT